MRYLAILMVLLCLGAAQAAEPYNVGMAQRKFVPTGPYDWRQDQKRALATLVWYPAAPGAQEKPWQIGPAGRPFFDGGRVAHGAALPSAPAKFPLVVLSHGTGGTASSLAWLGEALAAHGYVAAAVNHPGNNAIDGYTVPGFTLWWLRARDLSAVIDGLLADPTFGPRIDPTRIGAAGHSLGGYTVLALAGGIATVDRLRAYCHSHRGDKTCQSLHEFPDLRAKAGALAAADSAYRASLVEGARSYRDPRVRAVFAMAPALGPAFLPESLAHIGIPVAIVAGAGDDVVPVGSVEALAAAIPRAELTKFPAPTGHYVFVGLCLDAARTALPPWLCNDPPGVDRATVEAKTAGLAQAFFDRSLR
jgi:predicted dienelactone hydrolase